MKLLHHYYNEVSFSARAIFKSQSILFVNSNHSLCPTVEKAILQENHKYLGHVYTVNGLENAIETGQPDSIIVNIATEGDFNGYQLTKLIKMDYEIPIYTLYTKPDKKWAEELHPDGIILYSPNYKILAIRLKETLR